MNTSFWEKYKKMRKELMEKKKLTEPLCFTGCKHKYTGWFGHQFICGDCGVVLRKQQVQRNDVGYGFLNHITRPVYKPKKKAK